MKTRHIVRLFPFSALFLISSACLLSFTAQAADLPARGPIPFAVYDQDNNGAVSQEEFTAIRNQRIQNNAAAGAPMKGLANAPTFSQMDLNADGQLSSEELDAAQSMQRNQKQMQAGSGQKAMMGGMGRNRPAFNEIDLDGDGYLSQEEVNTFRSKRITQRASEGYPMRNIANMQSFGDMDLNHDEMIDPAEFNQHQMKRNSP